MRYIISYDIGTSGVKTALFNEDGNMINKYTVNYETLWFNKTWAEQRAEDWLDGVIQATKYVVKDIDRKKVIGISFSGQMMGCLCVDRLGNALRNHIIWADQRSIDEEKHIKEIVNEFDFYNITGHRPSASYTLAKLLWIKKNEPEIYMKTYKVLNAKDYIIYHLTRKFVTDFTDASGTNLLDINKLEWSTYLMNLFNIDKSKMPKLHYSTDIIGELVEPMAKKMGLLPRTKVVCGGGDGAISAIGAKSINDGDGFCSIGTSAWNSVTSSKPIFDIEMKNFNWVHVIKGKYLPCGTMQAAGASVTWIKDKILEMNSRYTKRQIYTKMAKMIKESSIGSNGVYYLPYLLGERSPRWNTKARGAFIGLTMENSFSDMVRATYEGISYNLSIILKEMKCNINDKPIIITGGGARNSEWMQIIADVYNHEIEVVCNTNEATSIGACVTCAVGLGIYDSFDVVSELIRTNEIVKPIKRNVKDYIKRIEVFEELYKGLIKGYQKMSEVEENNENEKS